MRNVAFIYRAMEEENALPKLGATATRLGIRPGLDIVADAQGNVHLPLFVPGEPNGLSCASSLAELPRFALPVAWGGRHKRTAVWRIRPFDLGTELLSEEDTEPGRPRHVSIGPSHTMPLADFVMVIEGTRSLWQRV